MAPKPKNKSKRHYDKYLPKPLEYYRTSNALDKKDHADSKKHLKLFVIDIMNNKIQKAIGFCAILKSMGILRFGQLIILLNIQYISEKSPILLSFRVLSHTNSSEKNILFTYFSLHDPTVTYNAVIDYLQKSSINMENKYQYLIELKLKISMIHDRTVTFFITDNDVSNSRDNADTDNDIPNSIKDDSNSSSNSDDSNSSSSKDDSNSDDSNDILNSSLANINRQDDLFQNDENDSFNVLDEGIFDNQHETEDDYFSSDFYHLYL